MTDKATIALTLPKVFMYCVEEILAVVEPGCTFV